jgi:outer membrane receptor protein involved in Fe transport
MMNAENLITFGYRRNNTAGKTNSLQQVKLLNATGNIAEAYKNINDGRNTSRDNDLTIDYQCNSKKNDARQLVLSCRWSNSLNHSNSYFVLQPIINYNGRASATTDKDKYREHTFQADYTQPIKKHLLETGISAIYRRSNSDYFYKDKDSASGAFVFDSSQSNNFNYEEDIYAGYLSLSLRMNKWGIRAGSRLELAKVNAHFTSSRTAARQEYLNLVPNVILSRQLKGIQMLKISYSHRLQRPHLFYLNPYVDLTDPRNISYGNPRLQPAVAHVFELAFNTFVKSFSINVTAFHRFINNSIQQFTTLGADTIARTTYGNVGKSKNSGLSLSSSITMFKKLNINMNGGINNMHFTNTIGGKLQTRKGITCNVSALLNVRLKNWRMGGNMNYNAANVQVQGRGSSFFSNSLNFNRYFFTNKINIGLLVNNPFRKYQHSFNEIDDPAFFQFRESFNVLRRYNMSLNYRFSKVKDNGNGQQMKP